MKKTITFLLLSFLISTMVYSNTKQGNYRWRDDSVGESTDGGWLANENTNTNVSYGTNIRLRIEIYNDSPNGTGNTLGLYYSTSSDPATGTWTKITASTDTFQLSTTSQYDEGSAPTDLLTNTSSLTHGIGYLIESSDEQSITIPANTSLEAEYCIQADAKASGTTYYFSIKHSTGGNITSYASLPGLTINKYDQVITFAELPDKTTDDADFDPGATSDLGLDISYESSDELVATIVDDQIHIVGAGTTEITASQEGNDTVNVATPVMQSLTVTETTDVGNLDFANLKMYPNPSRDIVNIETGNLSISNNIVISIIDITGKTVFSAHYTDSSCRIDLRNYNPGLYFVEIKTTEDKKILKLIIE